MKSIYIIRHQQAGILGGDAYATPPSDEEMAKVREACFKRFGYGHPKYNDPNFAHFAGKDHPNYGQPYAVTVEEWNLADSVDGLLATLGEPVRRAQAMAEVPVPITGGVGTVTNPGE